MKQILKQKDYSENEELEQSILQQVDNPFLINVDVIFETKTHLYYIMPYIKSIDFEEFWNNKGRKFKEADILFYST